MHRAPHPDPYRMSPQRSAEIDRRGARWVQFRPAVIESSPGAGKTRLTHRLSELSGVPLSYLDCSSMSNLSPILGQGSS